jgi:hypothetical protein
VPDASDTGYVPTPVDTSEVKLSDDLAELCELLARNNHEVWARRRMREGWRYGTARNDARKEHPSLVPYDQLPESEKDYDRVMVAETLRTALAMGFKLVKD